MAASPGKRNGNERAEMKYPWKVAWITGASGAICGEIARRLADQGVRVAATARPSERLEALATSSPNITAFPADVLDAAALKACAAKVEAELGPIDLALLGAGMYVPFDIRAIDAEGFRRTMALNVDGVLNGVAAALPAMLDRTRAISPSWARCSAMPAGRAMAAMAPARRRSSTWRRA
ncbi:MAG: hypothetical protein A49_25850 [Methyloceanibacter sp.]|nr:MAG: hypothetical protein A49_25850 [Methyloceanibacter sp.]